MRIPPSTSHWSSLRVPLLLILLWWLLLFLLLMWIQRREDSYTEELARLQLETLYSSIADMRNWNAQNGGVFVPENPDSPANPWLPAEKRVLYTADGQRLVKINPAYMVRLISENFRSTIAGFRIIAPAPKRPGNRADAWEEAALKRFDSRHGTFFELVRSEEPQFRSIAALRAQKSCLECHEHAAEGDLLGGISLTLEASPLRQAGQARKTAAAQAFGLIGLVGTLGIGGATWQLNRKKEKAEAANRLKSAFLANMTHDMRTPLTGMLGMAELLAQHCAEPRRRYLLEHLRDAASSLLNVVDGVMHYSLLEADRSPVRSEPFCPAEEAAACLDAVRPACDAKGLHLECRISPDVPPLLTGDAFRLRQALGNVLGNAVKFTEHGSVSLCVSCESGPSRACLLRFAVRDTGPGIPPGDRERIFESFEQGSLRQARSERGVGLGLAAARLIARAGGGDLVLEESSEQGSIFLLALNFPFPDPECAAKRGDAPSARAEGHSSFRMGRSEREGRKGDILVVEDTPVSALFLQEVLNGAGYSAHMADNGSDALSLLQSRHVDAVILDLGLPDMDGLDIARHIRAGQSGADAGTPVLLLSALPLSVNTHNLPEAGANCRFLLKPAGAAQLLEALESMLPAPGKPAEKNSAAKRAEAPAAPPTEAYTETPAEPVPEAFAGSFMDDGVFSRRDALDTADGNVPLLQRMIGAFLEEVPDRAVVLENASLSSPDLRRTAHNLKNSAALLGLPRLRAACAALENALDTAPDAGTAAVKNSLRADSVRELKRALAALRREQEGSRGPLAGDR